MPRKMDTPETELLFPIKGLDQTSEFEEQPAGTTRLGVNVRAFEALTQRGRGGSRAGLGKYLEDQIPEGPELIQHLNYIVDPTTPALISDGDQLDGVTYVESPDGYYVREGGSGAQLNANTRIWVTITADDITKLLGTTYTLGIGDITTDGLLFGDSITSVSLVSSGAAAAAVRGTYPIIASAAVANQPDRYRFRYTNGTMTVGGIQFEQANIILKGSVTGSQNISFTSDVKAGSLLLAVFVNYDQVPSPNPTDSLGNTWTFLSAQGHTTGATPFGVKWHYAIANAAGPCTITWSPILSTQQVTLVVLEYSGVDQVSPLVDKNKTNGTGTVWNTGSINVDAAGELLLGVFTQGGATRTVTHGVDYTSRANETNGLTGSVYISEFIGADTPAAVTVNSNASAFWAAVGACFRPGGPP
jgi:hypothetical protein